MDQSPVSGRSTTEGAAMYTIARQAEIDNELRLARAALIAAWRKTATDASQDIRWLHAASEFTVFVDLLNRKINAHNQKYGKLGYQLPMIRAADEIELVKAQFRPAPELSLYGA